MGQPHQSLRIGILGGGIGGLATAAFLHQRGLDSVVFEQAPELTEVGAGVVVAPNAARLLKRLSGSSFLERDAVRLDVGWEFRRWADGTVLSSEDLRTRCRELYGEDTYTAHRADLLEAIKASVPADNVRLGKKCTSVARVGAGVRLHFEDGSVEEVDVLIAGDGVHSTVRKALTESANPVFSGICAFRSLVPADKAPEFAKRPAQSLWIGPGRHLVHYPVSAGRYVNLVAFAPAGDYDLESWTAGASVDEFLAEFSGWDSRLQDLIRASERIGRWALLDRAPLDRWTYGNITLLGDAAHPMFPFYAQGAAQALEDAAVLADCLADSSMSPEESLTKYEELRRPRTTRIQMASHDRAHINHLPDGPEQAERDASFKLNDPLVHNSWIYGYGSDTITTVP